MTSQTPELPPSRTRIIVGLFVVVLGLVVLAPNLWPLIHYWRADRSEAVTARWVSSVVTHSSRDTVSVPAYVFERRIGPMVQECRIDLPQYRHAPDGKPVFETLQLVVGATCSDVIVLDDPPKERIPLVLLGLAVTIGGIALTVLALRRRKQ